MVDNEYKNQIRSFVESVEPDFNYQGTDGLLTMVMESAENVITINNYIESAFTDNLKNSVTDKYNKFRASSAGVRLGELSDAAKKKYEEIKNSEKAKKVEKIFKAILDFIQRSIAKFKGNFLHYLNKLKGLYASALEKIGKFVNDKTVEKTGDVVVSWYQLQPGAMDKFTNKMKDHVSNLTNILKNKEYSKLKDIDALEIDPLDDLKKDPKVFKHIENEKLTPAQFKDIYTTDISKSLNDAYKIVNTTMSGLLKMTGEEKREADKSGDETAKLICQSTNAAVNKVNQSCVLYMSKVFSVVIFAFHQALKATLVGLGKTGAGKVDSGVNAIKAKFQKSAPANA